jgi:hypothetical protein
VSHKNLALADLPSVALGNLSNVTLTTLTSGEVLKWTGTVWENMPDLNDQYTASAHGGLTVSGNAFRMNFPLFVGTNTPTPTVDGSIWFDTN